MGLKSERCGNKSELFSHRTIDLKRLIKLVKFPTKLIICKLNKSESTSTVLSYGTDYCSTIRATPTVVTLKWLFLPIYRLKPSRFLPGKPFLPLGHLQSQIRRSATYFALQVHSVDFVRFPT